MFELPNTEPIRMTESEYLEFELESQYKYEYRLGKAYFKMGANLNHNGISMSLLMALYEPAHQNDCQLYLIALRHKVPEKPYYFYPDLSLVCGETEMVKGIFDTVINPRVLIEIASEETALLDRSEKFEHYRQIPTLREYLIVDDDSAHIEQHWLDDKGNWCFKEITGIDANLEFKSIQMLISLADIYERAEFPKTKPKT